MCLYVCCKTEYFYRKILRKITIKHNQNKRLKLRVECDICNNSNLSHYRTNSFLYSDTNECLISNGGCDHICQNTVGDVVCYCREGFSLTDDQRSCVGKHHEFHGHLYL